MNSEKPSSIGGIATRIVGTLVGLLIGYGLSVGPALVIFDQSPQATKARVNKFYAPVERLHDTPFGPALRMYENWWLAIVGQEIITTLPYSN